jgi:threonine dehydratase
VLTCKTIDKMLGGEVYFKCENFQKAGAFKFRGATNAVFSLSEKEASAGVGTQPGRGASRLMWSCRRTLRR